MRASLIVGAERTELAEDEIPSIRAGSVILEIDDLPSAAGIRLDGRPLGVAFDSERRRGSIAIDLARYTGYHQLLIPPTRRFFFATEDAKLRVAGVVAMLDYLRDVGLAWHGALHFSGTDRALRDLRLDAAWLEASVPRICDVADLIAERPATAVRSTYKRARAGVPALSRTFALLRRERDLLEEHEHGPILVGGRRYAPREVVVRHRQPAIETIGNRRTTRLLLSALSLARAVAEAMPSEPAIPFAPVINELEKRLLLEPFRTLHRRRLYRAIPAAPTGEELFDARYAEVWSLLRALDDERHWSPEQEVMPEYAFATYADQVYQAFVATLLADTLHLASAKPLGGTGPHFSDGRYDLYVNTTPPASILSNWRDESDRPSPLRPDIVLHDRDDNRAVVVDAKYRNDGDRASADSLNEAQLYLQAYGITSAAVIYPPQSQNPVWRAARVAGGDYTLLEFPVRPGDGLRDWLADEGRAALLALFA